MPLDHGEAALLRAVSHLLGIPERDVRKLEVYKRSVDAREGKPVRLSYTIDAEVDDEAAILERVGAKNVAPRPDERYEAFRPVPAGGGRPRPVIIGTGPCGLFCALLLARAGRNPILLERGKPAGERARDVTGFWRRGWALDPESNVQFGEGGAGTFSDGKLYTQIKDREHRIRWILRELVAAGAPPDILVNGKPHIGTDRLITVVRHLREEIIACGGEVRFGAKVVDLMVDRGAARGVVLADGSVVETDTVVVAVGHSARDSFRMLQRAGVRFEAKPFSLGVRIEHPQRLIDAGQFGRAAGHPRLGAAAYKFVSHCRNGRSAYSFCMCPGGLVVAAASEPGGVVTNGMSSYARAEANANSGLMVDVRPGDFDGHDDPLAGCDYQRHWEEKAFELGGGNYFAPAQRVGDFLRGRASESLGKVVPSYQPGVTPTDLAQCLPPFVVETLRLAIPRIERNLRGFAHPDAVMVGVESRSSSPLRMPRHRDSLESEGLAGVFPAGEGAGYAGGIVSAAADGMRVAEVLVAR
ncbi:NAD(P)/FAD-dependent oxidoreductase [soil metagenome]